MSSEVSILVIGADPSDIDWLVSGLSEYEAQGWSVRFLSKADSVTGFTDDSSVVVLDSSIGLNHAGTLLSLHHFQVLSRPFLVGTLAEDANEWDHLIRQGAQDFLFKDRDGGPELRRTISRAIDRARILEATQEAEARLRSIIENIDDGVLILDEDSVVMFANPAVEDQLALSLHDLYGVEVPFDVPAKANEYVTIEPRDRKRTTLHVHTYEIRWEGRDAQLMTLRDVTTELEIAEQLRYARKAAEEASAMKSAFLANMSHELRMPLASIIGFAQLIEEGTDDEDFLEFAQTIQSSGNRLLSTINAVLEATRLDKHHIDPQLNGVAVDVLIEEVADSLAPLVTSPDVTIELMGTGSPRAMADEDFLVRILNNLIGNAIKFTSKGKISLEWDYSGDFVRISVKDTGIGISEEFIPRVFEEFAQESSGPGRTHEGSGLGLTIVKGLVDLMGGRIDVESEVGVGTHFSVYIPRADQADQPDQVV